MKTLSTHKWMIPLILLLSIFGGLGFASLVERDSLPFWGLYAAIGTAFMLWITSEFDIYIYIYAHKCHLLIGGAALALAIGLTASLSSNPLFAENVEGTAFITALGEKNEASNANEVWITQILVDGKAIDLTEVELSEGWEYRDSGEILALPQTDCPTEPLKIEFVGKSIQIQSASHQWSGKMAIQISDEAVKTIDLYSDNGGQKNYHWAAGDDMFLRGCSLIFVWVMAWAAAELLLKYSALGYAAVCVALWLISSEIQPAGSSYMVIGIVSLLAYLYARKAIRAPHMKPYLSGRMRYALIAIAFVASFCLFGYRLFLRGDFIQMSPRLIGYYLLGVLWAYPAILACLYGLEWIKERVSQKAFEGNETSRKKNMKVRLIATACFMGVMLLSWAAYYPGGYPADTVSQFEQARNGYYDAWHPVCHTLIIKLILSIWDNNAAVVLFQMLLFAILVGKTAVLAYEIGVRENLVYVAVTIFGLLPNQFTTIISPLKDFMFTYAMMWLTLLLIELVRDIECFKKPSYIIRMALALFFTYALRHNGVIPVAFVMILLLILTVKFRKQIKWRACSSIALAVIMIGAYNGPLFTALNVTPNAVTPYITMFCAVGSCLNKDKLLSESTMEKLEQVMPLENWKAYYSRFLGHDHYMFDNPYGMDLTGFSAKEAFSIYLEALIRYPDIVIKDRLDGANLLWDVTMPDESFLAKTFDFVEISSNAGIEEEGYSDGEAYYSQTVLAQLSRKMREFAFNGEREIDQISNLLLWRTGIYLLFMMVLVVFWHRNKLNRLWWAAMPLVGNTVAMVLVLYHQSYRYVFYVQLLTIILTLATFAIIREKKIQTKGETENG